MKASTSRSRLPSNETLLTQIDAVAKTATAAEVAEVEKLIAHAREAKQGDAPYNITFTPAMAGLLFTRHNKWNRVWEVKKIIEHARRMSGGAWKWNGEGFSFYTDGNVGNGQHRLGAAAIANYTLTVPVVFGVDPASVDTIDDTSGRSGAEHAAMDHLKNTGVKESILKTAASYFAKLPNPIPFELLGSAAEVHVAIRKYDGLLNQAIEIGEASRKGCAAPALTKNNAAKTAFTMLYGEWPTEVVTGSLHRVQEGTATESEGGVDAPLYQARVIIDSKTARGKPYPIVKQIGVIIKAATMMQQGVRMSRQTLQKEIDKELPSPIYQPAETQQAAE